MKNFASRFTHHGLLLKVNGSHFPRSHDHLFTTPDPRTAAPSIVLATFAVANKCSSKFYDVIKEEDATRLWLEFC